MKRGARRLSESPIGERAANANQIVKGEVESDMRRTRTLVTSAPAAADTKEQYDDGQARIQPAVGGYCVLRDMRC